MPNPKEQPSPSGESAILSDPARNDADRSVAAPGATGDVGDALRSIYQRTVQEEVPDEMIDLLGRLD